MTTTTQAGEMIEQTDVDAMADEYRAGVMPLRAVAWMYRRFRKQIDLDVTVADLMGSTGASRSCCYRAIQEIGRHKQSEMLGKRLEVKQNSEVLGPRNSESVSEELGHTPLKRKNEINTLSHAGARTREETPDDDPEIEAERRAVIKWGEKVASNLDYWTQGAVYTWSPTWVRLLLERKVVGSKKTPSPAMLTSIIQGWVRDGECEYLVGNTVPFKATGTTGPVLARAEDDFSDLDDL